MDDKTKLELTTRQLHTITINSRTSERLTLPQAIWKLDNIRRAAQGVLDYLDGKYANEVEMIVSVVMADEEGEEE